MAHARDASLGDLRDEALALLRDSPAGQPLDLRTAALIGVAVRASVTTFDIEGACAFAERALDAGATADQVHETLVLVSAIGVHTLHEGSRRLAEVLRERGELDVRVPLDGERAALWERYFDGNPSSDRLEQEVPGFLDALVRFSPDAFAAFFEYCAVPWRSRALPVAAKELISLAVDATPTHRYLPGVRLHIKNALTLGIGRSAILETLDIAAAAKKRRGP